MKRSGRADGKKRVEQDANELASSEHSAIMAGDFAQMPEARTIRTNTYPQDGCEGRRMGVLRVDGKCGSAASVAQCPLTRQYHEGGMTRATGKSPEISRRFSRVGLRTN
jgi:hypothetical protein